MAIKENPKYRVARSKESSAQSRSSSEPGKLGTMTDLSRIKKISVIIVVFIGRRRMRSLYIFVLR